MTKLVRAHFDSVNRHDLKELAKGYAENATGQSPNWEKVMHGSDSILFQYGRLFLSTPDLKYEILNTRFGVDHATVEYTMSGTLSNLEKDVPEFMMGKKYSFPAITVFEFKNNLIVFESSYFDQVAFLRQMGYFDQKKD